MGPRTGEQVQLTNLADHQTQAAEVKSLEQSRLHLAVRASVAARALVRIEGPDWLAFGEVVAFEPGDAPAAWVELDHVLLHARDLARQREIWTR